MVVKVAGWLGGGGTTPGTGAVKGACSMVKCRRGARGRERSRQEGLGRLWAVVSADRRASEVGWWKVGGGNKGRWGARVRGGGLLVR